MSNNQNEVISLFSLNIAHGRNKSAHQLFQTPNQIYSNLDLIASVISRVTPDIVALQEVDSNSFWNGRFDHIAYLAERTGYLYYFSGSHTNRLHLSYGTALLSKYPLANQESVCLINYPFLPTKGFVTSTIQVNSTEFDIISLHLDFASSKIRCKQIEQLIHYLLKRDRPCIIMGDFNVGYYDSKSPLPKLLDTLNLTTFDPEKSMGGTFRYTKKRLDWIFIPSQMQIKEYLHLSDVLSDHSAIYAKISLI